MKKIYKLLIIICMVLIPVTVNAAYVYPDLATCKTDANNVSSGKTSLANVSGSVTLRSCVVNQCTSNGASKTYTYLNVIPWTASGTCANGNRNPYQSISYGYLRNGSCSGDIDKKYTYKDVTYDCTRNSDGSTYVKPTPTTKPVVTNPPTQKPTQRPTQKPTQRPTQAPTVAPTQRPTEASTEKTSETTSTTTTTKVVTSDSSIKLLTINKKLKMKNIVKDEEHDIRIPYNLDDVDIEVETTDKSAMYEIIGNKGISTEGGVITVKVTSSDNTSTTTVTFNVSRYTKEQADCTLANIVVEGYNLDFSSSVEQYTLKLNNNEKSLDLKVTPSQSEANYSISGNEKLKNNSKIKIIINAVDGTECSYQITVKKSSNFIIYILLAVVIGVALFFTVTKLREYLTKGTGKYKYE